MQLKHNLFQLAVAFDQFLNVLVCMVVEPKHKHWADETFSAHLHRHYLKGEWIWLRNFVNCLFFLQEDHCKEAFESECNREHSPISERIKADEAEIEARILAKAKAKSDAKIPEDEKSKHAE